MSDENKAFVSRLFAEVWSQGKLELLDELVAPDYALHLLHDSGESGTGREVYRRYASASREAFPDLRVTIQDMIAEGDKVVARLTFQGTHLGGWREIAPTGRRISWAGVHTFRIAKGTVVESWQLSDRLAVWRQLGYEPAAGAKTN